MCCFHNKYYRKLDIAFQNELVATGTLFCFGYAIAKENRITIGLILVLAFPFKCDVLQQQKIIGNIENALPTGEESPLAKITRDSAKITVEQVHGLMSQVIKDILFNSVHQANRSSTEPSGPEPMIES
ncbi:hypothetical protein V8G54_008450 [Vigna mungo]|uniref:Cop9 signalosome subunit 5 C-terminal domain-containing protein n=1 Tax=Vigna mungo TaxID=3915 RepID=A0AAQ3P775_VIGMU